MSDAHLTNIVMRQQVGREFIRLIQGNATPEWIETLQAFVKAFDEWPAPTDADLDAAALARPVVRALVEAATPFVSPMQNADYSRQLREYEALKAALAAAKEKSRE